MVLFGVQHLLIEVNNRFVEDFDLFIEIATYLKQFYPLIRSLMQGTCIKLENRTRYIPGSARSFCDYRFVCTTSGGE